MLIQLFFPTNPDYMATRFIIVPYGVDIADYVDESTAIRGAKWLLALAVLPVLIADAGRRDHRFVNRIAIAWLLGVCFSAFVAVSDISGLTSINSFLMSSERGAGRLAGLTSHPNQLGASVAIAAPLAVRLATKSYFKGVSALALLAAGAVVSGSRGGQVAFALALAATLFLLRRDRRLVLLIVALIGLSGVAVALTGVEPLESSAALFRFNASASGAEESNEGRLALAQQALIDFSERPLAGVGLAAISSAHNIYLQLLASGGILLAGCLFLYFGGALRVGLAEHGGDDPVAMYFVIVVLIWLALGLVENQLTDRYLYFPIGCIAGLQRIHQTRKNLVDPRVFVARSPSRKS